MTCSGGLCHFDLVWGGGGGGGGVHYDQVRDCDIMTK